ncbi:MAG: hypothetical protein U5S82_21135 [Gammaproteobacteria bacterium]|nr:hypothetical protein [Gammaproteobacteria bacterium]
MCHRLGDGFVRFHAAFPSLLEAATRQPGKLDTWGRDSTGLSFDGTRSAFAGRFIVALVNARHPGDRSGLTMTLAYAVGIDWPARVSAGAGIDYSGEAAVFVLGAIGALVGISALAPGKGK